MEKNYVSEFTVFMDRYLKEHPEVVKDQQHGWDIYWNPKRSDQVEQDTPHSGSSNPDQNTHPG